MSSNADRNVLIIKRNTVVADSAQHGGAWKIAYADFVTAMMAFFLLMWLLNATTEKQRAGLADYFDPTVIHQKVGGQDAFDGQDAIVPPGAVPEEGLDDLAREIESQFAGIGAESMLQRNLLRHVVTRVTDEGLVIELGDLADEPLFDKDSATPTPTLRSLAEIVARVLGRVGNDLAFAGHVRAFPEALISSPAWDLSDSRAQVTRRLMEASGLSARRVLRVVAHGDREARADNPMDPTNNRIEVILLRP